MKNKFVTKYIEKFFFSNSHKSQKTFFEAFDIVGSKNIFFRDFVFNSFKVLNDMRLFKVSCSNRSVIIFIKFDRIRKWHIMNSCHQETGVLQGVSPIQACKIWFDFKLEPIFPSADSKNKLDLKMLKFDSNIIVSLPKI